MDTNMVAMGTIVCIGEVIVAMDTIMYWWSDGCHRRNIVLRDGNCYGYHKYIHTYVWSVVMLVVSALRSQCCVGGVWWSVPAWSLLTVVTKQRDPDTGQQSLFFQVPWVGAWDVCFVHTRTWLGNCVGGGCVYVCMCGYVRMWVYRKVCACACRCLVCAFVSVSVRAFCATP